MGVGPTYSADDYVAAMLALGLRGRAWPTEPGTTRVALLEGLAESYVRSGSRAVNLISDASPATTLELVPEWEKSLGLPDPCTPLNPTMEQRRAAILAKFMAAGGQSIAYYTSVAAALGFQITITELSTPHHWQITVLNTPPSYFKLGTGTLNDYFWVINSGELECRLRHIMPAHTVLTFVYP